MPFSFVNMAWLNAGKYIERIQSSTWHDLLQGLGARLARHCECWRLALCSQAGISMKGKTGKGFVSTTPLLSVVMASFGNSGFQSVRRACTSFSAATSFSGPHSAIQGLRGYCRACTSFSAAPLLSVVLIRQFRGFRGYCRACTSFSAAPLVSVAPYRVTLLSVGRGYCAFCASFGGGPLPSAQFRGSPISNCGFCFSLCLAQVHDGQDSLQDRAPQPW